MDIREQYVKPAVLRLEYSTDVSVSMASNCKTSASASSGTNPCTGGITPCTTVGS